MYYKNYLQLNTMNKSPSVRLIRLRDGSTLGATDYALVVNDHTVLSFNTRIADAPSDDNLLLEDVEENKIRDIAHAIADALDVNLKEEFIDKGDALAFVESGQSNTDLRKIADFLESSNQGSLIDLKPGLGGVYGPADDDVWGPPPESIQVINTPNVRQFPITTNMEQLLENLQTHHQVFFAYPLQMSLIDSSLGGRKLTDDQRTQAITQAKAQLHCLEDDFIAEVVNSLANQGKLQKVRYDEQWIPTNKTVTHMCERLEAESDTLHVLLLTVPAIQSEIGKKDYSYTSQNTDIATEAMKRQIGQLLVRASEKVFAAVQEVLNG